MKLRGIIILFSFAVAFGFLYSFPVTAEDVGVVAEEPEPELPQITLDLSGKGCETNLNESELLRLKGVVGVDIESQPGKIVVTYDPAILTKQKIMGAVGKKKGGCAASEHVADTGGGGKK